MMIFKAEDRQVRWGRERGDDMQQRAQGWNQTWAAAIRTQPKWYTLYSVSYRGAPNGLSLKHLLFPETEYQKFRASVIAMNPLSACVTSINAEIFMQVITFSDTYLFALLFTGPTCTHLHE